MVDSCTKPPISMSGGKWENFEDDARNSGKISVGRTDQNNLPPEKSELITGDATFKQQGESSPQVNGLTGTPSSWENLGDISGNLLSTSKANSPQIIPSGSRGVQNLHGSDQLTNIGLEISHETTLESKEKENPEEKFVQSSELSDGETDGGGTKFNGTSNTPRSLESKDHTTNNLKWTTFEEGRDKESSTEEAKKAREFRSLKTENKTPANSTMASFDSSPARAAEIMPNLISITESGDAKMDSPLRKQESNNVNIVILTEKISSNSSSAANNAKSAVSNAVSSAHKDHKGEGRTLGFSDNDVQRGKNWVCFGEDGKVVSSIQPVGQGVLYSSSNSTGSVDLKGSKVTLSQPPTRDLAVNCKTETAEDIGLHADEQAKTREEVQSNTASSVGASMTLTAADLDVLAQNTWMQFDDSVKGKKQRTPSADKTSSGSRSSTSWVTFGESSSTSNQTLSSCVLDVGGKNELSSSPSSPNPFILPRGTNPFKPATLGVVTNPFKAENSVPTMSSQESVSTSMLPLEASVSLVSEINLSGSQPANSQPVTPSKPTSPKGLLEDGNVSIPEITSDQVDTKTAILPGEQKHLLEAEEDGPLLDEKATSTPNGSWSMLLRFPDKKRKIGSRDWKSVVIRLEGTTLQIYEEYELSAPFREIPLQAYFAFTAPKLQSFERGAKVHTVKLEYIKYTESRSLRHRGTIEHTAEGTAIIKIASPSHVIVQELLESVNNSIRLLPAYRDRGITYRRDEVFVDVDDVSHVLVTGDGTVLRKNSKVLVKLRAFLTGDPECQLVLNDVRVREREEARLRGELKPQRVHHWVKLRHCDFHKCVNVTNFEQSHAITFHPLDACTFELMRFRVEHHKPLPLLVKTSLNVHNEQRVELKAEIQVCQETKMAKYVRNNVVFRFPIPESWVPLFRTGKRLRGEKSIQSSRGRRAAAIKSRLKLSKCAIAVTLGKAMYEPEYGSVVWRIDQLPFIHSKVPVDAPQMLTCSLDLPPGMDYPENYKPTAELEYDVAYVLVSDTNVIAVKVSNQNIPDKWVCYRAFYHYDVDIDISKPASGPVRDVGCLQQ